MISIYKKCQLPFINLNLRDKIIVIDEGKIVGLGKHEELQKSCPAYKTMVELQKLDEQKGE